MSKGKTVAIYATLDHAARMKRAKELGVNVSKICNDVFDKYLTQPLEKAIADRSKELQKLINRPQP